MSLKNLFIVLTPICVQASLLSQDHLNEAEKAFKSGQFKTAINKYNLQEDIEKNKNLLFRRGLAYFHLNEISKAIHDFTTAKKLGNNSTELFLKMAQLKQHNYSFEEASFFYKEYLIHTNEKDPKAKLALRELKNCIFSLSNNTKDSQVLVQSFGDEINSPMDEIKPIQSYKFGNVYYYSSNKPGHKFDIQSVFLNQVGKWEINDELNGRFKSSKNELAQDLTLDGKNLLYTEEKKVKISSYHHENEHIIELKEEFLEEAIDIQIVNKSIIVFAHNGLKGYGGYDLFSIEYNDGSWSNPINLGPAINSPYDERSPYMSSVNSGYILIILNI